MATHMGMEDGLKELHRRREKALLHGGKEQTELQHSKGRLNARERIDKLLDGGSFWELGMLNLSERAELADITAADGRVAGFGKIDGRTVLVTADDRTVLGGSDGQVGCFRKHQRLHAYATRKGYPTIFIGDNLGGLRLPDGMGSAGMSKSPALPDFVQMPRITPRVATIQGECFGEPTWIAVCSDFVVMTKGSAMAAAGPRILKIAIGEEITPWELGALDLRYRKTGEIDRIAENDEECMAMVREFLSYMPSNNTEEPPFVATKDPVDRRIDDVGKIVPDQMNRGYDMHRLIKRIVDDGKFFEMKPEFGKSVITTLGRVGGYVMGFIANNPMFDAGAPSVQSIEKAVAFICLCDSFNIPFVNIADVPGMFPGSISEKQKLPTRIMSWVTAGQLATVPKFSITIRKAYGIGWNVMLGPYQTADFCVAWPTASISFVDPIIGVDLVHGSKIAAAADPDAERARLLDDWGDTSQPWKAAEEHHLDDIIDPRDTRKWIYEALQIARGKKGTTVGEHRLQTWPRML
ncbi:MAG: carboxyl transferase domain-containing protein [Dehalococcoidales bacterium]|nr:carboxyl transferase domain-containing protein [Dehalococcoidales bacterium]